MFEDMHCEPSPDSGDPGDEFNARANDFIFANGSPTFEELADLLRESAQGAAAVAFGLMGMAEAIGENGMCPYGYGWRAECYHCTEYCDRCVRLLHDCTCPARVVTDEQLAAEYAADDAFEARMPKYECESCGQVLDYPLHACVRPPSRAAPNE